MAPPGHGTSQSTRHASLGFPHTRRSLVDKARLRSPVMDWLERTAQLRQWSRSGTRAPHKPLLLLYALGRFQQDAAGELR